MPGHRDWGWTTLAEMLSAPDAPGYAARCSCGWISDPYENTNGSAAWKDHNIDVLVERIVRRVVDAIGRGDVLS